MDNPASGKGCIMPKTEPGREKISVKTRIYGNLYSMKIKIYKKYAPAKIDTQD